MEMMGNVCVTSLTMVIDDSSGFVCGSCRNNVTFALVYIAIILYTTLVHRNNE